MRYTDGGPTGDAFPWIPAPMYDFYGICEDCGQRVLVREHQPSWGRYAYPGMDCTSESGSHRVDTLAPARHHCQDCD